MKTYEMELLALAVIAPFAPMLVIAIVSYIKEVIKNKKN
tara:strand:- start:222 stop:338 length:117 start_codon:yes stop_codon:yes gene_type:complete